MDQSSTILTPPAEPRDFGFYLEGASVPAAHARSLCSIHLATAYRLPEWSNARTMTLMLRWPRRGGPLMIVAGLP